MLKKTFFGPLGRFRLHKRCYFGVLGTFCCVFGWRLDSWVHRNALFLAFCLVCVPVSVPIARYTSKMHTTSKSERKVPIDMLPERRNTTGQPGLWLFAKSAQLQHIISNIWIWISSWWSYLQTSHQWPFSVVLSDKVHSPAEKTVRTSAVRVSLPRELRLFFT